MVSTLDVVRGTRTAYRHPRNPRTNRFPCEQSVDIFSTRKNGGRLESNAKGSLIGLHWPAPPTASRKISQTCSGFSFCCSAVR